MKYTNNTPINFQAPRTPSPCFASRYTSTGIRIFQYSVCQYSYFSPTLRLSSLALFVLALGACMTCSIPRLDGLEGLWQAHIHIHTHHNYTSSTMLILAWPLVKHLGANSLLLKVSQHPWNTKTTLQSSSKLSGHPLHALQVDIYPLASGYSNTLFASTAPSHLL